MQSGGAENGQAGRTATVSDIVANVATMPHPVKVSTIHAVHTQRHGKGQGGEEADSEGTPHRRGPETKSYLRRRCDHIMACTGKKCLHVSATRQAKCPRLWQGNPSTMNSAFLESFRQSPSACHRRRGRANARETVAVCLSLSRSWFQSPRCSSEGLCAAACFMRIESELTKRPKCILHSSRHVRHIRDATKRHDLGFATLPP